MRSQRKKAAETELGHGSLLGQPVRLSTNEKRDAHADTISISCFKEYLLERTPTGRMDSDTIVCPLMRKVTKVLTRTLQDPVSQVNMGR